MLSNLLRNKKQPEAVSNAIYAAANGRLISLDKVKDEVFSTRVLGDGIAIELSGNTNTIVSPANGTIKMLFPTMHAFGLVLDNGIEILIHIGLDTVELKGKGFRKYVSVNSKVRKGDPIIRIDREFVEDAGYDTTLIMVFTSIQDCKLSFVQEGIVKKGKSIVATYSK